MKITLILVTNHMIHHLLSSYITSLRVMRHLLCRRKFSDTCALTVTFTHGQQILHMLLILLTTVLTIQL